MRRSLLLVGFLAASSVILVAPASANRAAADACAAKLPANAKMIYAATITSVTPGANLQDVVRSKTRSLVMDGKISRGDARPAAEAAGACLKQAL
jgi:hypothetical protein